MVEAKLMHEIGDAMERNPGGWWREFQLWSCDTRGGSWIDCPTRSAIWRNALDGNYDAIRPKPQDYTLHVEGMPKHDNINIWKSTPINSKPCVMMWAEYPDEATANEALEKLTAAMGVKQ